MSRKGKKNLFVLIGAGKVISLMCLFMLAQGIGFAWEDKDLKTFEQANEDYRQGRFQKALEGYQTLSQRFPEDAALLYNEGNAHFRLGNLGAAVLAYDRAKWLEPRHPDVRYNLKYLLGSLEYRIEDKRNWYVHAGEKFLSYFTEQEIRFVVSLLFFLSMASWAVSLFLLGAPPWGKPRKALFLCVLVLGALWGAKNIQSDWIRAAIVMAKEAPVRYGPSEGDQVAVRLREGLKVYVVERRQDWSRVLLVNGESGWMDNRQIAEIRLK